MQHKQQVLLPLPRYKPAPFALLAGSYPALAYDQLLLGNQQRQRPHQLKMVQLRHLPHLNHGRRSNLLRKSVGPLQLKLI